MDTRYVDPPTPDGGPPALRSRRRWPRGTRLAGFLLIATAGVWALCALSLVVYTSNARAPEEHVLRIPDGTSERIAAGENPLDIPVTWSFLAGDTLKLVNDDKVDHLLGSYKAPAHQTVSYTLRTRIRASLFCTLHPSSAIIVNVEDSSFDWHSTVVPTAAFGPSVGLVLAIVSRVLSRLDDGDEPYPHSRRQPGRTPTPVP